MDEEHDDELVLSANAANALKEFLVERDLVAASGSTVFCRENWQLSQFWYDDATADLLARECIFASASETTLKSSLISPEWPIDESNIGKIACISCPSVYSKLQGLVPDACLQLGQIVLLEYDRQFNAIAGDNFVFYDFNDYCNLSGWMKNAFDVVIADPPFLSEECLAAFSETIKYLGKQKLILCTGATMEEHVYRLLSAWPTSFRPNHQRNLANDFKCYVNYEPVILT